MNPLVQISLDLTNIDEAIETASMALRAGVDWLEAGTPLAHLIPMTEKNIQVKCHLVDNNEYYNLSNRTVYPAYKNRYAKGMRKMMME